MSPELLEKADAIANIICESEPARMYWQARVKMERHERAQSLFEELKLKTNQQLGLTYSLPPDHPKVKQLQEEIEQLEEQLRAIPVAIQYKEAQAELNELMQGVIQLLLSRLAPIVPVELGPRVGCGKGPNGTGCTCGANN
jgi:cell fate (sporulation/competence/biofilm development) regulator YmcA (YheA/YmcA/DUF963 family)